MSVVPVEIIVMYVSQDTMDRDVTVTVLNVTMGHVPITRVIMVVRMDIISMQDMVIADDVQRNVLHVTVSLIVRHV